MKHKKFNEYLPYVYYLERISDGMKYLGARHGHINSRTRFWNTLFYIRKAKERF